MDSDDNDVYYVVSEDIEIGEELLISYGYGYDSTLERLAAPRRR